MGVVLGVSCGVVLDCLFFNFFKGVAVIAGSVVYIKKKRILRRTSGGIGLRIVTPN